MDHHLGGRFRAWALVGAYGDDLVPVADRLAAACGFDAAQRTCLRRLGRAINYNAYGEFESDVRLMPARLYDIMARWGDPFAMQAEEPIVHELEAQRDADLRQALALAPRWQSERARVVLLPHAPWSRRVSGSLANELATAHPDQAQAVLAGRPAGDFSVSVRAPRAAPGGAMEVCAAFGGSGRAGAAGIDALPAQDLERFLQAFSVARWGAAL
jgi:hypothetical protein